MTTIINNIEELIDFVNRSDVSFKDAELLTHRCFGIAVISFRDFDPVKDTKEKLIEKIKGSYQQDILIHWTD